MQRDDKMCVKPNSLPAPIQCLMSFVYVNGAQLDCYINMLNENLPQLLNIETQSVNKAPSSLA